MLLSDDCYRIKSANAASDQIMSKGYYDSWTQADIDGVVTWRHNLER